MSLTSTSSPAPQPSPDPQLRIATLLPSATDICIALGLSDYLVGITHECDLDSVIRSRSPISGKDDLPCIEILTKSGLVATDSNDGDSHVELTQAQIDHQVKNAANSIPEESNCNPNNKVQDALDTIQSNSIYPILKDNFLRASPNLVLTQNLCSVCAPSPKEVYALLDTFSNQEKDVKVFSLDPQTLMDVAQSFVAVARLCGVEDRGIRLHDLFLSHVDLIQETAMKKLVVSKDLSTTMNKKRVLCLEWLDPPFDAGHWIPDMIEAAGCTNVSFPGTNGVTLSNESKTHKSKQITWEEIYASDPDVILVACCGFDTKRNVQDALSLSSKLSPLRACKDGTIFACNGDLHFARPGPHLIDGIKVIAQCAYGEKDCEKLNFTSNMLSLYTSHEDATKPMGSSDFEKIEITP